MANKKAFQSPPPDVQIGPRPQPVIPPPYPDLEPTPTQVHYPSEDGEPMADDTWQMRTICAQYDMLSLHFASDPNAFVGTALLMYFTEGEPADVVAPDVFVALGVPDRDRDWYKVWAEGKAPDFVLEVASDETFEDNLGRNKDIYERLGVREYCVYDPKGGRHWPRLQLFRLAGGVYQRVGREGSADGPFAVTSETLGLELRFEDDRLRLWDQLAGEYLLEHAEEHRLLLEMQAKRLDERTRRIAAERETERFERESERIRREIERLRREAERFERKAERLERKAEAESLARQKVQAEIDAVKEGSRRRS